MDDGVGWRPVNLLLRLNRAFCNRMHARLRVDGRICEALSTFISYDSGQLPAKTLFGVVCKSTVQFPDDLRKNRQKSCLTDSTLRMARIDGPVYLQMQCQVLGESARTRVV